ncbi:MAG TPA: diguanylate cyclase [Polyangia bacterium]|nr:diguanylate cyclase [Polyangia bacterium]
MNTVANSTVPIAPLSGRRPLHDATSISSAGPFAGLIASLAVLISIGVVSQDSAGRRDAAVRWTVHTHQVIEELQQVLYGISTGDGASRGFSLSGDGAFLAEIGGGVEETLDAAGQIRRLTGDNQAQQLRLDRLQPMLTERARLLRARLEMVRAGESLAMPPAAYRLSRDARGLSEEMLGEERDLLARRTEVERVEAEEMRRILFGGVAASAAALLGAFLLLYREIRRRRRIESDLLTKHGLLRSIVQGAGDAIFVKDLQGHYLMTNDAGARLLGPAPNRTAERADEVSADSGVRKRIVDHDLDVIRSGETRTVEEVVLVGGVAHVHSVTRAPHRDGEGHLVGLICTSRDITERHAKEQAHLREITLLLQNGELLQACHGVDEAYEVIAKAAPRFFSEASGAVFMFPASRDALEARASWGGPDPASLPRGFSPEDCWALRRGQPHFVADSRHGLMCPHVTAPLPGSTLCHPLIAQGDVMGILHLEASSPLKEDLRRRAGVVGEQMSMALANLGLRETLRNQSIRDPLTGLFNRRYLEETLERELRRAIRANEPLGVLMIDVDHFKQFNDLYGHEAGDYVLREVAATLRRATRASDVASRIGGEEMVILLPGADLGQAERKADQLRDQVSQLDMKQLGHALGQVTISVGVSALPNHGEGAAELLRIADSAMYRSKREGRNRVSVGPQVPS